MIRLLEAKDLELTLCSTLTLTRRRLSPGRGSDRSWAPAALVCRGEGSGCRRGFDAWCCCFEVARRWQIRPYVSAATTYFGLYFGDDSGSKVADRFLSQVAMAQHFLLSAAARSLSLAKVMRMSDLGVENVFPAFCSNCHFKIVHLRVLAA